MNPRPSRAFLPDHVRVQMMNVASAVLGGAGFRPRFSREFC
jgi:hypothetical protein